MLTIYFTGNPDYLLSISISLWVNLGKLEYLLFALKTEHKGDRSMSSGLWGRQRRVSAALELCTDRWGGSNSLNVGQRGGKEGLTEVTPELELSGRHRLMIAE